MTITYCIALIFGSVYTIEKGERRGLCCLHSTARLCLWNVNNSAHSRDDARVSGQYRELIRVVGLIFRETRLYYYN